MKEFLYVCGAIFLILAALTFSHVGGIVCAFLGILLIAMSTRVGGRPISV